VAPENNYFPMLNFERASSLPARGEKPPRRNFGRQPGKSLDLHQLSSEWVIPRAVEPENVRTGPKISEI
jgi:hypothetical protein